MINRYSSRRTRLDQTFLNQRLQSAQTYDRIAGYFRPSILEVAGESLESITGTIRVICNSDLNRQDVDTAKAANYAMRREWCATEPEQYGAPAKPRFARLYQFLRSGKLQVKVLPREKFGLVHGKAGVITLANGDKTAFMGSTNETYDAWKLHYELVWEDSSPDAIAWSLSTNSSDKSLMSWKMCGCKWLKVKLKKPSKPLMQSPNNTPLNSNTIRSSKCPGSPASRC
jgi:PLD-like domain